MLFLVFQPCASVAVDMWAIGCTFAELMIREIFLPGIDDTDQLSKIFYAFGTPSVENWPFMNNLPKFVQFSTTNPPGIATKLLLRKRFSAASEEALSLFLKLMEFNPNKRMSAADALQHPYFTARGSTR